MNRLRQIIDAIAVELNKYSEESVEYRDIYRKLGNYTTPYYFYHKELIEFYEQ